jgi:hypothetical protein
MQKVTMKEKVLQYVESKGEASFTEIQRFIVDTNYGAGTYDYNTHRGYYTGAFRNAQRPDSIAGQGYFLRGNNRLSRKENGKYIVIRKG